MSVTGRTTASGLKELIVMMPDGTTTTESLGRKVEIEQRRIQELKKINELWQKGWKVEQMTYVSYGGGQDTIYLLGKR
jgi:hypothetical protein